MNAWPRPGWLACAIGMFAFSAASRAFGAEPVRLEWARLEGASECIDAASLEARVSRRLGTHPFEPTAARRIEGVVRHEGGTWRAEIAVRARADEHDPPLRVLKSNAARCDSLGDAVVLAVALAIDPDATLAPPAADTDPPATPPPTPPPRPPPPEHASPVPAPSPAREGNGGHAAASALAQVGLLPAPSFGASLLARGQLSRTFELGLELRILPDTRGSGATSFQVGAASGTLHACALAVETASIALRGCAGASLGTIHAVVLAGERSQPGQRAWFGGELGAELGLRLSKSLSLLLAARAVVPLPRYRFGVEGSERLLFRQAPIAGLGQAGLELSFGGRD